MRHLSCLNCGTQLTPPALAYCPSCLQQRQPPHPRQSSPRLCADCGLPISPQARKWQKCHFRARRRIKPQPIVIATPATPPRLKQTPTEPAIIGATCQPDWQRAVAWESRPQRWETLRPAERRSA